MGLVRIGDDASPPADGPDQDINALIGALRTLDSASILVGARRIDSRDRTALHDIERCAIARAVDLRQDEFASGRALLRSLIGTDQAIPVSSTRAPVLPSAVRGSLAHDRSFVVAAISRDPSVRSIGIDIEPTVELAPEMAVAILRADESSLDAHLAFSLKEAAYKAWSNIGGRMLGQHEVRLTLDHRNFLAEVIGEATAIRGTFAFAVDRCLAMAVIRA